LQFLGGKSRIAPKLVTYIKDFITPDKIFIEPFIGGASFTAVAHPVFSCEYKAGDLHQDLVMLWNSLQDGWEPPLSIDKTVYSDLKHAPPSSFRALVGYGASFGGKWFGGYASNSRGDDYYKQSRNAAIRKAGKLGNIEIKHQDYSAWDDSPNTVYYCDPPYLNTHRPGQGKSFDHDQFWSWARTRKGLVFVSEYTAPADIRCVLEIPTKTEIRTKTGRADRVERLFITGQFCEET
jgi:DNA adenine methylase